jgi:hypothetical protein
MNVLFAAGAVVHDPVALDRFGSWSGLTRPNARLVFSMPWLRKVSLVGCYLAVQFRLHLGAQKNQHYVL